MTSWKSPAFRWAALLGAALAWRLVLFIGPQGSDDLAYSEYALDLSRGQGRIEPGIFGLRLGYVGPMALAYAVLGVGSLSLVIFNLAAAVAEIALAWRLAREFLDEAGAWRAAWIVAFLPLEVFFSTEAHTDLPLAALCSSSVLAFLRARERDRTGLYILSGLLLGAAHLVKETAFLELAVLAVLAGRSRLRPLWALGGFVAVLALEAGFFAAATGDPFFRLRAAGSAQAQIMSNPYYEATTPTARRIFLDLPAQLFWPGSAGAPFLSFLPLLAAAGAVGALRRRLPERAALLWTATLLLLLNFWPSRLVPYRPAMVAHARILLVCAVPMAILASSFLGRLPLRWSRILAALFFTAAAGNALILHADGRRLSAGARLAFQALPPGGPVVSDPRTISFFRFYDGYRGSRPWLDWDREPSKETYLRVVNDTWIAFLEDSYHSRPPPGFLRAASARIFEAEMPSRLRLRPLLLGRVDRAPPRRVRIERVAPGP